MSLAPRRPDVGARRYGQLPQLAPDWPGLPEAPVAGGLPDWADSFGIGPTRCLRRAREHVVHGGLARPVFCTLKSKGSLWGEQLWSSIQGLVRCRPPADVALRVHWWSQSASQLWPHCKRRGTSAVPICSARRPRGSEGRDGLTKWGARPTTGLTTVIRCAIMTTGFRGAFHTGCRNNIAESF